MNQLQGKVALITGGGSGIGLSVARSFLQQGAKVFLTGRNESKLRQASADLDKNENCAFAATDVAQFPQVQTLVKKVLRQFGRIDILVNNAGVNIKDRSFKELTPENWQLLLRANLDGAFYCIREVFPCMRQQRDGLIININSISGKRAGPLGGTAYVASKFGMTGLASCVAAEEVDSGVRMTSIFPGEVDTPILEARPQAVTDEHRRRILRPEDVAAAVLFVATLPAHVNVPELVIKPACQAYV